MTPNIAIVQIENPHWRGIRLWLPLFLLWIPLLLLSPLILLVLGAFAWPAGSALGARIATFWAILVQPAGDRCPRERGREPGYGSGFCEGNDEHRSPRILSLIAMGRITPREAERLLAVWDDRPRSCLDAGRMLLVSRDSWSYRMRKPAAGACAHGSRHCCRWLRLQWVNHAISIFTEHWGGNV